VRSEQTFFFGRDHDEQDRAARTRALLQAVRNVEHRRHT
jgi:hypothetical protein